MHKSLLAALTVAALSSTAAFAQGTSNQPATRNPTPLSRDNAPRTYSYQDEALPPAADNRAPSDTRQAQDDRAPDDRRASAEDERARDLFCRRDAARRTGYGTSARDEQVRGTIGGTLGGAALGAIIGGAAGNAGAGAAIGAGAGLVAGSAIGADNARRAASDAEAEYGDAYYACIDQARDDVPPPGGDRYDDRYDDRYAADYYPPPPPVYYRPAPYPYYQPYSGFYGPRVFGPSFGFSFGIGSGYRGGFGGVRGGFGGPRGGFRGRR